MKAFVDKDTCIACEACVGICPEVFSMGADGKSEAIKEDVPADVLVSVGDAMDGCPVSAITLG